MQLFFLPADKPDMQMLSNQGHAQKQPSYLDAQMQGIILPVLWPCLDVLICIESQYKHAQHISNSEQVVYVAGAQC